MRIINPFAPGAFVANDPQDFKMPYKLYGKTEREVMQEKYQTLNNFSHGPIVRLIHRIW